jgi:hypothetical protein
MSSTVGLQQEWQQLMKQLPAAAHARHPAQPIWPVRLDHCFGRIILDNVIGVDRPWREKIAAPAVRSMSTQQLEGCIRMGKNILDGSADLVALNQQSLKLRGKEKKAKSDVKPRASTVAKKEEQKGLPSARERYTQTTLRSSLRTAATTTQSNQATRRRDSKDRVKKIVD